MKKLLEKLVNLIPFNWVMSLIDTLESIVGESSDPHRQNVTQKSFYKRILHHDKDTFGYYNISSFYTKGDQNIRVHYIEERKGWDTRIKLSESDVNKIMTTDEFKDLVESQDYETNNSVLVIGDILKDMDIPFTFDQVILD
tara:strand:- start:149 stop:571 length:423 start_codon:yes stop_codon:yes gene_type:complete